MHDTQTTSSNELQEKMLDILANTRIKDALNNAIITDIACIEASKKQNEAIERLKALALSPDAFMVVDNAISLCNHYSTVYGTAAYRLGFADGIKLVSEIIEI